MDVSNRFSLADKVILITGASSGLGMASAVGLARLGANLTLVARRKDRLERIRETVESMGRRCSVVTGDVAEPNTARQAVSVTMDVYGRIDVLLNNAGVATAIPSTRESPEEFRRVIDVNLNGSYWMAQACAKVMLPGANIINVSSILGLTTAGLPQAAYASSKSGIIALTRDLAAQWTGRKGIRVNAIAPGFFHSEMTSEYPENYLENIVELRVPAKRVGSSDEFVSVVAFLASDAASYISGVTLPVDGGLLTT